MHYTELLHKFDAVRKEHIEHEQTRKLKESAKRKSVVRETNDWNFDMMMRNPTGNNTSSNFTPF